MPKTSLIRLEDEFDIGGSCPNCGKECSGAISIDDAMNRLIEYGPKHKYWLWCECGHEWEIKYTIKIELELDRENS